jgi:hypothetical protein
MAITHNLKIIILETYHVNDSVVIKVKLINESKSEKIKNPIFEVVRLPKKMFKKNKWVLRIFSEFRPLEYKIVEFDLNTKPIPDTEFSVSTYKF